jgi:hypothetical protein
MPEFILCVQLFHLVAEGYDLWSGILLRAGLNLQSALDIVFIVAFLPIFSCSDRKCNVL